MTKVSSIIILIAVLSLPILSWAVSQRTLDFSVSGVKIDYNDNEYSDMELGLNLWVIYYKSFSFALNGKYIGFNSDIGSIPAVNIASRYSIRMHRRFSLDISALGGMSIFDKKFSPDAKISIGGRYFFSPRWQIGLIAAFERIFSDDYMSIFGGGIFVEFRPGFHDEDGDWIPNEEDKCSDTPAKVSVDKYGCGIDSDGDGVFDGLDKCPNTPLAALVDSLGCSTDSDNDGVPDGVDRCADTPKNIPVDTTGCPRDIDHDGVPDYIDSCANTPEGAIVDNNGCPTDSDEDGVPDGIDQCEKTPTGFEVDRFGCPTIPTANGVVVYDLFDDNLELTANAMNSLYRVAKRIRAYPDRITKMLIYTDTEGSPKYNRNRARAVGRKLVKFLEEQGVPSSIVEVVPMGEKDPIIPGSSPRAKEKDRRVVFTTRQP